MRPSSASTRSEAVVLSQRFAGQEEGIDASGPEPPAGDPPGLVLLPFCFWLPHAAGPTATHDQEDPTASARPRSDPPLPPDPAGLRCAIAAHLASLGWPGAEPLRWAITAVDPLRGLQLEGLGLHHAEQERR
jgi:hypothetical protein